MISSVSLPRWNGDVSSVWDVGVTANWVIPPSDPSTFSNGDEAVFDDTALGTTDVALDTTVTPNGVVIDNALLTYTITSAGQMSLVQDVRVTVAIGGLAIDRAGGGGRLDLGAGQVSIAAGGISAADLRADIIAGRNGGAWNGTTGIISSTAATSGGTRTVGYVVAGDGAARVSYAAAGAVDLSGSVNVFDLVGINTAAVSGQGNYWPAAPTTGSFGSVAAVPEPASWLVLAGGLADLVAARRVGHRARDV